MKSLRSPLTENPVSGEVVRSTPTEASRPAREPSPPRQCPTAVEHGSHLQARGHTFAYASPRMLSYLRIQGLALLDDVALELVQGLNVLTGETGAGKSIIVDALTLLRGARGRVELVRSGDDAAVVQAQFELNASTAASVAVLLGEHGIRNTDATSVVTSRTLPRSGRSRCFLQSELTTQSVLGSVGEHLIDICSQHEHHSLTHIARHIDLLDQYAKLGLDLAGYAEAFDRYQNASVELERVRAQAADAPKRLEYLKFQLDELDRINPQPGEFEALKSQIELLRDAHRWAEFARAVQESLYDGEGSIMERLSPILEQARRGSTQSPHLESLSEHLAVALSAVEEANQSTQHFAASVDIDPGSLDQAEERLHELTLLRRKHGTEFDDLATRLVSLREECAALERAEEHLVELEAALHDHEVKCRKLARKLHEKRAKASDGLAQALEKELSALHLPKARLQAPVEWLQDAALGPRGLDRVEFLFSANPGEPLAPLSRVASGGELSRVLLAVKSALTAGDRVSTYVFDEVDAGVGGAVAEAIGIRLSRAAEHHQVLCITHLPQIAAFADAHFRVDKRTQAGRTITRVTRLDDEARVEELARMLGGARVTDSAREHARQLIGEARRARQRT